MRFVTFAHNKNKMNKTKTRFSKRLAKEASLPSVEELETCTSLKRQKVEPEPPKSFKEIVAPKPLYKPQTQSA